MFLPINCNSVNNPSMLPDTILTGTCSHYLSLDKKENIQVYEYDSENLKRMVACDLVIYSAAGDIYMHELLLLKDGNWRNSGVVQNCRFYRYTGERNRPANECGN